MKWVKETSIHRVKELAALTANNIKLVVMHTTALVALIRLMPFPETGNLVSVLETGMSDYLISD